MQHDDSLADSLERLRLVTSRLKISRLKLPPPGGLFRVRTMTFLSPVVPIVAPTGHMLKSKAYMPGSLLFLVCVNIDPPKHSMGDLIDPIELCFMDANGILVTPGIRASADVMLPYEAL